MENNEPKLIINLSEEDKLVQDIIREVGLVGMIELAMRVEPSRDYTENALETAKDVIKNVIANGGTQMFSSQPNTPAQCIDSPTGLSPDRISIDY